MKNRNQIYDIIRSQRPETIDELQRQLFVTNQYLLDLYRQYSNFWWQPTIPDYKQLYQEAWKDWETIWANEQIGKAPLPAKLQKSNSELSESQGSVTASISCNEFNSLKLVSATVGRSNSIDENRRFSAELPPKPVISPIKKPSTNTEYPKNNDIISSKEFPRNNDTIPSSMQIFRINVTNNHLFKQNEISNSNSLHLPSSTSSPVPVSSGSLSSARDSNTNTSVPIRKGSSWRSAVSRLNRKSGGSSRSSSQIIEREPNCISPRDKFVQHQQQQQQNNVFNAAPLAVRQLSSNELKKLEKSFVLRLKQPSTLPLHVEIAPTIQKHLQTLFAQTKSTFYQKLFSHLQSWYLRYVTIFISF